MGISLILSSILVGANTPDRPIQTYNGRGVSKGGITKCYHSIIHTSSEAPRPKVEELPNPNPPLNADGSLQMEYPMLESIRVKARKRSDIMDRMARLNYIKIYAVEHNVKVYDFGMVRPEYMPILKKSFKWVQQDSDDEDNGEDDDDDDDNNEDEDDDDDDDDSGEEPAAPVESKGKQVKWKEEPRKRRESSAKDKDRPKKDDKSKGSMFGGRKRR